MVQVVSHGWIIVCPWYLCVTCIVRNPSSAWHTGDSTWIGKLFEHAVNTWFTLEETLLPNRWDGLFFFCADSHHIMVAQGILYFWNSNVLYISFIYVGNAGGRVKSTQFALSRRIRKTWWRTRTRTSPGILDGWPSLRFYGMYLFEFDTYLCHKLCGLLCARPTRPRARSARPGLEPSIGE